MPSGTMRALYLEAVSFLYVVYQFLSKPGPLRGSLDKHHSILFDCSQNQIFLTVPRFFFFEFIDRPLQRKRYCIPMDNVRNAEASWFFFFYNPESKFREHIWGCKFILIVTFHIMH